MLRPLGDRRFEVQDFSKGSVVQCRLGGSVGYKVRSQRVKVEDWVLVAMRDYESDTQHYDRKGEILLRYNDTQVRQLSNAGVLPQSARESLDTSSVVFVDADSFDEADEIPRMVQSRAYDMLKTPTSDHSDEDEGEHDDEQEVVPKFSAFRVLEEDLPPPSFTKKVRRSAGKACDALIQIDLHQRTGFRPQEDRPARVASQAPVRLAPVAPVSVTIRARVKFWDANLTRPLLREDVPEVTINPRHDRPFALDLRRAR